MTLDMKFLQAVDPLLVPGMGTENVALLLYSLLRMTRPKNVLEVGMGYTSPFMAMALFDNEVETATDKALLTNPQVEMSADEAERFGVLNPGYFTQTTTPTLHAIDDFSMQGSSSVTVLDTLKNLNLGDYIRVYDSDYRGSSQLIDRSCFPLDFVWFDCGSIRDYRHFISEYWDLINPDKGMLLLHFTHQIMPHTVAGGAVPSLAPGPVVNEIKRQQLARGMDANFEVLSLLEPHKQRQGSVTMIRRLPPSDKLRGNSYETEMEQAFQDPEKPFPKL